MATSTFFSGTSVMNNAAMSALTLDAIWQNIRHGEVLCADVERLRKFKRLDATAYNRLKTGLPFFCCAMFNNNVRHSQYFVSVSAFVVDIDKFSGEIERLEALRNRVCTDERVAMCFISPSGDGLKVVFHLAEPCHDLKAYSDFYKSFVCDWAKKLDLEQFVDLRTTDATRACFLSHDPSAYLNPMAEAVELQHFSALNLGFDAPKSDAAVLDSVQGTVTKAVPQTKTFAPDANCSHHIQPSAYAEVLTALQAKARPNPLQRTTVVPEPLVRLVAPLTKVFLQQNIVLISERDVQFGKKLQMQCANDVAELVVYYGKKGFSVVLSPKRGTNPDLADLCVHLTEQAIFALSATYHVPDVLLN
jgi:VirE N-terminal domain